MVAETATDLADLFSGSDLAASITLANGCVVAGRFAYGFAESLDYNGRVPTFLGGSVDLASVAIGDTLTVEAVDYTLRAIEQGERTKLLFLEKP